MTSCGDVAKGVTKGVDTIRRKYYGKVPREPQTRRNREIRISPLRVIDQDGKQIGVIERDEALRMAEEAGLDLVEVQANIRPPLCKIMDFGKYKYEQSKKKAAKPPKANEVKEVRLGRSVKIDKHDVELRVNQARKFLLEGHRVMFVQRFRGREMAHPHLGEERLKGIAELLADIAAVTAMPKMNGRQMTLSLAPDKAKLAQIKAREEREAKASQDTDEAPAGEAAETPEAVEAQVDAADPPPAEAEVPVSEVEGEEAVEVQADDEPKPEPKAAAKAPAKATKASSKKAASKAKATKAKAKAKGKTAGDVSDSAQAEAGA